MDPDVRDFSRHYLLGSVDFGALVMEKTHVREAWCRSIALLKMCRKQRAGEGV